LEEEEELKEEDIKKALRKMKLKKGIPLEAWKYVEKRLWKDEAVIFNKDDMEKRQNFERLEEKHSSSYIPGV